mgnify:CR=1 FL=1
MRGNTNAQNVGRGTDYITIQDIRKNKNTTPTQYQATCIYITDVNGKQLGSVVQAMFADGAVRMSMNVFNTRGSTSLNLQINPNGSDVSVFLEKTIDGNYTSTNIATL